MSPDTLVIFAQICWPALCGMMLFSRFVFPARGAAWMRRFFDIWTDSTVHRVWGWVAFADGLAVLIALAPRARTP